MSVDNGTESMIRSGEVVSRKKRGPKPQKSLPASLQSIVNPYQKRIASNRMRGQKGGLAVSAKYGPEWKERRSSKAGNACLARYGPEFYSMIARGNGSRRHKTKKQPMH